MIGDSGFDMDNLKTTSFSSDTVYRSTQDGTPAFAGYHHSHSISITVDADGDSLEKLLGVMTSYDGALEFRVSYIVRDLSELIRAAKQSAVKETKYRARKCLCCRREARGSLDRYMFG